MYDHPDNKGTHEGVSFSFKKAPLIFIQSLPKLKEAQKILDKGRVSKFNKKFQNFRSENKS